MPRNHGEPFRGQPGTFRPQEDLIQKSFPVKPSREGFLPGHTKIVPGYALCTIQSAFLLSPLEPIREVSIHDEAFAAASRLSMMRIMAKRTNAATVVA
jgi:hypothetical protein